MIRIGLLSPLYVLSISILGTVGLNCSDLARVAPSLIPNASVYAVQDYPANTTFKAAPEFGADSVKSPVTQVLTSTSGSLAFLPTAGIRSVCVLPLRSLLQHLLDFQGSIRGLASSTEWSGRFAMVGNGGDSGGVNFPDMGVPLSKYHFAVASTDTGHNGTAFDGTFALNGPETQIDFGHRAVHLTAVYSKRIIKAHYGKQAAHNYWIGCSSGGKQGLKEVQAYPNEFDGVIAGAAAQWWTHLQAASYRQNFLLDSVASPGHLVANDTALIGALVLDQCDDLDGLKDGIITNPLVCKPDLSSLDCENANHTTPCLSSSKIETMFALWANWTSPSGELLFPGFLPGAEGAPAFTLAVSGQAFGPGFDYFEYQILNKTTVGTFDGNEMVLEELLKVADATDPGQANAIEGNIQSFLRRGKLLTYVGLADIVIPSGSSFWYFDRVHRSIGYPANLAISDGYRLFPVPGMNHCGGGTSASSFGAASQLPLSDGGLGQSSDFDKDHDMILAMIAWVEEGIAPDVIIGTKYINDTKPAGIEFQRKLCPHPKQGKFIGGDSTSADSFKCL